VLVCVAGRDFRALMTRFGNDLMTMGQYMLNFPYVTLTSTVGAQIHPGIDWVANDAAVIPDSLKAEEVGVTHVIERVANTNTAPFDPGRTGVMAGMFSFPHAYLCGQGTFHYGVATSQCDILYTKGYYRTLVNYFFGVGKLVLNNTNQQILDRYRKEIDNIDKPEVEEVYDDMMAAVKVIDFDAYLKKQANLVFPFVIDHVGNAKLTKRIQYYPFYNGVNRALAHSICCHGETTLGDYVTMGVVLRYNDIGNADKHPQNAQMITPTYNTDNFVSVAHLLSSPIPGKVGSIPACRYFGFANNISLDAENSNLASLLGSWLTDVNDDIERGLVDGQIPSDEQYGAAYEALAVDEIPWYSTMVSQGATHDFDVLTFISVISAIYNGADLSTIGRFIPWAAYMKGDDDPLQL
jgi:hypothetical protein